MYPSSASSDGPYPPNPDYSPDLESQKLQQQKLDTLGPAFRSGVNGFLNNARPRALPPNQYRDTISFYPASPSEAFSSTITSPVQSQMPGFEHRANFDFTPPLNTGSALKSFTDSYNSTAVIQGHQLNGGKPPPLQQAQQTSYPLPYSNGPQMSSQTPYGPHVVASSAPSAVNGSSVQPPSLGASLHPAGVNNVNAQTNSEEISTIFVVGFPDDMQEREFQNMFTFSPDFEAATLKIPNKEYTAYGNVTGGLRNGAAGNPVAGANDPYNLVTVNQGGVIIDNGRDGIVTSWPAIGDDINGGSFSAAGTAGINAPRKQIIGFAKFKTREAALQARDGLQGRKVDIDKGAVLKAEMAKKNLHTKRGVGPVATTAVNSAPSAPTSQSMHQGFMNSSSISTMHFGPPGVDVLGARDRELGAFGALGRLNQWRDPAQDHLQPANVNVLPSSDRTEEDRRVNLMNAMGLSSLGSITRGPRERAEDEERERRKKEKDTLKIRSGNPSAYDAFHSVPPGISRHMSNLPALLSPTDNEGGGLRSLPVPQGPWDDARGRLMRPRSSSRSVSPSSGNPEFAIQAFSPSIEPSHFQYFSQARSDKRSHEELNAEVKNHIFSVSNMVEVPNADVELARALGGLDINSEAGKTSPELPSPSSGASSRNGIDQNPPINTLYVGNLPTPSAAPGFPQDHLEANLRELFQSRPGYRRLCFRQKPNGPMCFVEFEDVAHATKALNDLYGNTLKGLVKGGIRLSYSKNPLGVRTPTSAGGNGCLQQLPQNANGPYPPFPPEFQTRFHEDHSRTVPVNLRRDMIISTSPMPSSQPFMSDFTGSSSPRFSISTSVAGPLPGLSNAFVPRYGHNLSPTSGVPSLSTFSPFGLSSTPPPHSTIPDQQANLGDHPSSHPQHLVHSFPPSNNLEATRA